MTVRIFNTFINRPVIINLYFYSPHLIFYNVRKKRYDNSLFITYHVRHIIFTYLDLNLSYAHFITTNTPTIHTITVIQNNLVFSFGNNKFRNGIIPRVETFHALMYILIRNYFYFALIEKRISYRIVSLVIHTQKTTHLTL